MLCLINSFVCPFSWSQASCSWLRNKIVSSSKDNKQASKRQAYKAKQISTRDEKNDEIRNGNCSWPHSSHDLAPVQWLPPKLAC